MKTIKSTIRDYHRHRDYPYGYRKSRSIKTAFRENLLIKVAGWLDKNPDYCWGSLVMWAFFDPIRNILTDNYHYKVKSCDAEYGPYCGKCAIIGRLPWEGNFYTRRRANELFRRAR